MDGKAARYAAAVRTQTARQETMADLAEMTEELLRAFYISYVLYQHGLDF